jgi:magnesium chelatase subunit I
MPDNQYSKLLDKVAGLKAVVSEFVQEDITLHQELVLFALAEHELLQRDVLQSKIVFRDFLAGDLKDNDLDDEIDLRGFLN